MNITQSVKLFLALGGVPAGDLREPYHARANPEISPSRV